MTIGRSGAKFLIRTQFQSLIQLSMTPRMTEIERIFTICASILLSLSYSYYITSKIQKWIYRLIFILPIFYIFTILPLYLSFTLTRFITSFFISWLGNLKLILLCFNKGPLSWGPGSPRSLLLFITVAALPCKIKLNIDHPHSKSSIPTKPTKIPLNLAIKTLLLAILITMLHNYSMHPKLVLVLYLCLLYLNVDVLVASFSKVVQALLGVELEPPSDEPYLSTSLQDFWGRRWNLMITNILRHSVYLPVRSAANGLLGKDKASPVAVFISFVVSGLMHEFFLFYYLTDLVLFDPWGLCYCGDGRKEEVGRRPVVAAAICFDAVDSWVCGDDLCLVVPSTDYKIWIGCEGDWGVYDIFGVYKEQVAVYF